MRAWLEAQLPLLSGSSTLAAAILYALPRWHGLTRFLYDGRVELNTNPVEPAIRPVALGRKNHLFAGSDGGGHRWAVLCSLIEFCKLNDIEPYAHLRDVRLAIGEGQINIRIKWSEVAPREDVVVDIPVEACPCCGESASEMLDRAPACLRVVRITRPKCACRTCETVVQARAPVRPIAGGLAMPGLLAHMLVSKYCDHTPLYR